MATPAVVALAERFPSASIHVASGTWSREAWIGVRYIRGIIDAGDFIGGRAPSLTSLSRLIKRIRRGNFDTALVLERSMWPALAVALAGVPTRAGLASGWRGIWHTRRYVVPPLIHEADLYLRAAGLLGASPIPRPMEYVPSIEAIAAARAWLSSQALVGRPFAILHPGGGTNPGMALPSKRWPADRFAEIATRLRQQGIVPIIVGGPSDRDAIDDVIAASPGTIRTNAEADLAFLAALARESQIYVGNDSGPTHLARAARTPTVVVFGPSDERRYGPWGTVADGAAPGEAVAEPHLGPDAPAPPWLDRDVRAVTVDRVWSAVGRVLAQGARA
ncbi:MAG: glycosyltransferase family 9 protein [Chloroflexota bacterium]|nr:MAG: glycosyltransferase family 9 protein [Chloroflexota bacterium]